MPVHLSQAIYRLERISSLDDVADNGHFHGKHDAARDAVGKANTRLG